MSVKTIKEFEKELRKKLLMSLKLKEKPILILKEFYLLVSGNYGMKLEQEVIVGLTTNR